MIMYVGLYGDDTRHGLKSLAIEALCLRHMLWFCWRGKM